MDYLVFQLCEGDLTKESLIWETKSYSDCIRWVCFKQFEAHLNELMMKAND
jgi:hypothetical protein